MVEWQYIAEVTQHLWPGLLAALIFVLGAIVVRILPKFRWLATGILLVIITPVAIPGFWFSAGRLGVSDWDQYFSYYHVLRRTITEFHQFPLWNPWICGGSAALGDPEFPVISPTFLPVLFLGVEEGLKITIYFATAVGALGMLMLGKRLGLSVYATLLAAIGASFSSVNLLEIVEGHPNIFAAMWVPWIFWSWLTAYRSHKKTWSILCGIFLALTFFGGGIYLLLYTALAFLVLITLAPNHKKAFLVTLKAGLWALGFASVKLIPTLFWLRQFPDKAYASSAFTLPYLHKILFGRYLHNAGGPAGVIPNQGSGWHEYGAYIGPFIGALTLIGLAKFRQSRVVRALVIAAVLAILLSSFGPFLKPIFDELPFIPRSNISRIILFAVIPIALLAGYGLDIVRKQVSQKWLVALFVFAGLSYAAGDLFTVTEALSHQAFVIPYPENSIPPAPSPISHLTHEYRIRHNGVDYSRAYAAVLQGYGTKTHCTVLGPGTKTRVRTIHDKENFGPVLDNEELQVLAVSFWSPNRLTATVRATKLAEVQVNTNYAEGWWVLFEGDPTPKPAQNLGDHVATIVPPGNHTLTFYYRPRGMLAGVIITAGTILAALGWEFAKRYRGREGISRS